METLLYIIFFVSCLVLVIAVLLQPGKTDAGALFTSGISSAALNPRGTQSVLSKLTIGAATVFMLSALLLSLPAITGSRSVLETEGTEENQPVSTNQNANTSDNSAANAEGKKEQDKKPAGTEGSEKKATTEDSSEQIKKADADQPKEKADQEDEKK